MRRFALIFGMLLTLMAGVWGVAPVALAWCCVPASCTPSASDEHDCCRADSGESNAQHSQSQETSHDARRETSATRNQTDETHAGMNCGGADASSTRESAPAALVQRGLSCAECCAGGRGQTPATAAIVAPEPNKVKRAAGSDSAGANDSFAPAHVYDLAPTQHAPPVAHERRHILIGVFLI